MAGLLPPPHLLTELTTSSGVAPAQRCGKTKVSSTRKDSVAEGSGSIYVVEELDFVRSYTIYHRISTYMIVILGIFSVCTFFGSPNKPD